MPDQANSKFIVAEISKSWTIDVPADSELLSNRFEQVINFNDARGYELYKWELASAYSPDGKAFNETIIAIFRLKNNPAKN